MAAGNVDIVEIATQAAEAAAGIGGLLAGFKLIDLAKDYYKIYKQQREFYYNTFQNRVERPLAQEVYGEAAPTLDYAGRVATAYNSDTGPFGGRSGDGMAWWERHANAYGAGLDDRLLQEYALDSARVKSDWTNYLFRFEEQYYDVRTDIRWRKRLALHNVGIKSGTQVSSALGGALGEYQGHIADFGNQLATYGNGIARYVGYKRGMSDTSESFDRMGRQYRTPAIQDMQLNRDSRERLA